MNERYQTVAIIGSGAGEAVDYEFDVAYVANSALSRLSNDMAQPVVHLLSAGILAYQQGHDGTSGLENYVNNDGVTARLKRLSSLRGRVTTRAVIIDSKYYFSSTAVMQDRLGQLDYGSRETTTLQRNEINRMLFRLTGVGLFFKVLVATGIDRNILSVARFLSGRGRVSHQLKPSTGMNALILAIAENGNNARYRLDGFSFDTADTYVDGNRIPVRSRNHMPFDAIVFKELSSKYNIELLQS